MTDALAILALIIAVMALVWVVLSQRHRRLNPRLPSRQVRLAPVEQLRRLRAAGSYRGVRVEAHCTASSRFAGRDFGFENAPDLPASGCDAAACECNYIALPERRRLADRRSGLDRRISLRMESEDRRNDYPRRKADLNAWASFSHL